MTMFINACFSTEPSLIIYNQWQHKQLDKLTEVKITKAKSEGATIQGQAHHH
jgi:hypothetical protein